jgi:hypothetical protein
MDGDAFDYRPNQISRFDLSLALEYLLERPRRARRKMMQGGDDACRARLFYLLE